MTKAQTQIKNKIKRLEARLKALEIKEYEELIPEWGAGRFV